jgi:hypothetical protein
MEEVAEARHIFSNLLQTHSMTLLRSSFRRRSFAADAFYDASENDSGEDHVDDSGSRSDDDSDDIDMQDTDNACGSRHNGMPQEPLPPLNPSPRWDHAEVFLSHARIHVFARAWGIAPLAALALRKLQVRLLMFRMYRARVRDVVRLIEYAWTYDVATSTTDPPATDSGMKGNDSDEVVDDNNIEADDAASETATEHDEDSDKENRDGGASDADDSDDDVSDQAHGSKETGKSGQDGGSSQEEPEKVDDGVLQADALQNLVTHFAACVLPQRVTDADFWAALTRGSHVWTRRFVTLLVSMVIEAAHRVDDEENEEL